MTKAVNRRKKQISPSVHKCDWIFLPHLKVLTPGGGPRCAPRSPGCSVWPCRPVNVGDYSAVRECCVSTPPKGPRASTRCPPFAPMFVRSKSVQLAGVSSLLGGYKPSLDKLSTAPRHRNTAQINTVISAGADPRERRLGGGRAVGKKEEQKRRKRQEGATEK